MFIELRVIDDCQNVLESYGEICVRCGKCGRKFKGANLIKESKLKTFKQKLHKQK